MSHRMGSTLLHINRTTGICEQLPIPFPEGLPPRGGSDPRITGPAVLTAPDGSIWFSQLGSYSALVRIDPSDNKRTLYNFGGPLWAEKIRFIHLAFAAATAPGEHNTIYALASDLLDCQALDAIMMIRMCPEWKKCIARRLVPLPTQNCASHRVISVDVGIQDRPDLSKSIVITELAASKLLQIKTAHIGDFVCLEEGIGTCAETGCEVRTYGPVAVDKMGVELGEDMAATFRGQMTLGALSTLGLTKPVQYTVIGSYECAKTQAGPA